LLPDSCLLLDVGVVSSVVSPAIRVQEPEGSALAVDFMSVLTPLAYDAVPGVRIALALRLDDIPAWVQSLPEFVGISTCLRADPSTMKAISTRKAVGSRPCADSACAAQPL